MKVPAVSAICRCDFLRLCGRLRYRRLTVCVLAVIQSADLGLNCRWSSRSCASSSSSSWCRKRQRFFAACWGRRRRRRVSLLMKCVVGSWRHQIADIDQMQQRIVCCRQLKVERKSYQMKQLNVMHFVTGWARCFFAFSTMIEFYRMVVRIGVGGRGPFWSWMGVGNESMSSLGVPAHSSCFKMCSVCALYFLCSAIRRFCPKPRNCAPQKSAINHDDFDIEKSIFFLVEVFFDDDTSLISFNFLSFV